MSNANTPHSRRLRAETASARRARLQGEGWRQVNILLPPETIDGLDRLAEIHGTRTAAMIEAIRAASS